MTSQITVIARSVSDVAIQEVRAPGLPRCARNDDTGRVALAMTNQIAVIARSVATWQSMTMTINAKYFDEKPSNS